MFCLFQINASFAQCNFKPIGHRGGSSYYYPENTLVSLEQGFMEGIYAAEVDVRFTADSTLVLMHDSYIDRSTNGTGQIEDLTLSYIKTLDAGSWKSADFAGTPVPTLKEALLLAAQYEKKLYLNMKVFAPELIAKTLRESNLPEDIVLLDPDDLDKVEAYHEILPNTPLVYFGELPEESDDSDFFEFLRNHHVVAIEIPADYIYNSPDRFGKLRDKAHANQIELWAYTVNDTGYFQFLKDFGIEAIETDRPSEAFRFFCTGSGSGYFPEKRITGQWDFKGNLRGTIGSQLVLMGDTTIPDQKIRFGTTKSFGLPNIEETEVEIARIPAFDAAHALRFFSNIAPEGLPGGLDCDNTFSLIFDLLKPAGNNGYTSILQTSNNNSDDADFFLNGASNSFGILEQYNGGFEDSTWIRIALVFDLYNEKLDEYLDGNYIATIELENSMNGRFCLNNNWGVQSSNFFSDNDGETNPLFVSSIQIRNYAMDTEEIKTLGDCKAIKINPSISTELACPEFAGGITSNQTEGILSLHAFAGDTVNYRWEIDKGNGWERLLGDTFIHPASSTLQISNFGKLSDTYKFRCIAFNDCQTISDEFILKNLDTQIHRSENPADLFAVYPNPSGGKINIDFKSSGFQGLLRISTIQGSLVYEKNNPTTNMQVELKKGTYIIQFAGSNKSEMKKLIVN